MAMDIQRVRREVANAALQFAFVEAHPTSDGGVYVKALMQTSAGKTCFHIHLLSRLSQSDAKGLGNEPDASAYPQQSHVQRRVHLFSPPEHVESGAPHPDVCPRARREMAQQIRLLGHKRRPLARRRGATLMPLDFGLLSMTELRTRPGEILDRVADKGEAFIIERNGQRKACLVPLSVLLPDIPPARIADEIQLLVEQGEKPSTSFTEDKELAFRFPEKPGRRNLRRALHRAASWIS